MKIVFFMKNGNRIEVPIPDPSSFNFIFMMKSVRADGYLLGPAIYIESDSISAAFVESAEGVQTDATPGTVRGTLQ